MTQRHTITAKAETVLMALSSTPKGDTKILCDCIGNTDRPSGHRGLRRILARLVAIGYAAVEQINGRDYWTITDAGERHWPSDEEIAATMDRLRALVAA